MKKSEKRKYLYLVLFGVCKAIVCIITIFALIICVLFMGPFLIIPITIVGAVMLFIVDGAMVDLMQKKELRISTVDALFVNFIAMVLLMLIFCGIAISDSVFNGCRTTFIGGRCYSSVEHIPFILSRLGILHPIISLFTICVIRWLMPEKGK